MADVTTEKTWARRMAEALAEEINSSDAAVKPELLELALEAAGELKCVRLKALLGQCCEIIRSSQQAEAAAICANDFLEEVVRELR